MKFENKGIAADLRLPITRESLAQCQRLGPDPSSSHVYRFDEKTVLKFGDGVRIAEAATMRLVRDKTSLPVPEVYDAFLQPENGHCGIMMEYIDGVTLDTAWPELKDQQKAAIVAQLRVYMDELRGITGSSIGSVDGTSCEDQFFSHKRDAYGPFNTDTEFKNALIKSLRERADDTWTNMIAHFIQDIPQRKKFVLTHNDLAPRNILIRDAKIVAILDWEFSGFYPEYWEYVKAYFWPDWQSFWVSDQILDQILDPYRLELGYLLHARDMLW